MPLVETESLVLKTYNLAEADKIVLLLTRDHGIIRGVAKGAKRLKSRFGSALEPFSVVRITYFQKEVLELVSIQRADLVNSYFSSASEPGFLQKFSYLTDVLVGSQPLQDPNEALYRMMKACLQAAADHPDALDHIGLYFEIWLLKLTGYLPQWENCAECRQAIGTNERAGLNADQELVCGRCRRLSSLVEVSSEKRAIKRDAIKLSPTDFARSRKDHRSIGELSEIFKQVISKSLGRRVSESQPFVARSNSR